MWVCVCFRGHPKWWRCSLSFPFKTNYPPLPPQESGYPQRTVDEGQQGTSPARIRCGRLCSSLHWFGETILITGFDCDSFRGPPKMVVMFPFPLKLAPQESRYPQRRDPDQRQLRTVALVCLAGVAVANFPGKEFSPFRSRPLGRWTCGRCHVAAAVVDLKRVFLFF